MLSAIGGLKDSAFTCQLCYVYDSVNINCRACIALHSAHGPAPDAANPDSFELHSLYLMLYDLINTAVMGMCRCHGRSSNSSRRTVRTWLWATSRNSTNMSQIVKCMKCTFLYRWQEVFCFDCVNLLIWINIITLHTYNSCWFILIVANICSEYTGLVVMC